MTATTGSAPRTLADWLRGWPDERLAALLRARPDLAVPVPPDMGVLTSRAGVRLSVSRALDAVDALGMGLLDALALSDAAMTLSDLHVLYDRHLPIALIAGAVDRLRDLALVWGDDDALHLVGAVRDLVGSYPAGLGRPAATLLALRSNANTQSIADALGVASGQDVIALFEDPVALRALVDAQGSAEREVLRLLAFGTPVGEVRDAMAASQQDSPVRHLIRVGLLMPINYDAVELPREVGLLLRNGYLCPDIVAVEPELVTRSPGVGAVDRTAAGNAATAVAKVDALLSAWAAEPPKVLRAGGLGVRDLRRASRDLDLPESVVALLAETAYAARLVDMSPGGDPEWMPTGHYDTWRSSPPESQWLTLAKAWLAMTRMPALVGVRDERDKARAALGPDIERPGAAVDRRWVLEVLAESPAGSAPTAESVLALLTWRAPHRGGSLRDAHHQFTLDEAEALGACGQGGPASFMKLLLDGDEREAARSLAGLLPEPLDHVLIQPDLTIVAPGPLERSLAAELMAVADIESTGGATVYRVSADSVRRALDAGRSASELHELFATRSRTPVPQGLTYLVDDMARRHGQLRAGAAGCYLRCDDESLLAEVAADRRTASLRLRRLAPTVLISASPVAEVLEVLRTAGYAPAGEATDGALLVAREEGRRTKARPRPNRTQPAELGEEQSLLAVQALRAGDRAARASRRAPVTTRRTGTADVLAFLQDAARERRPVWIGYVDSLGQSTDRVLEPRGVDGGFLWAWDPSAMREKTFSLHRITGVADIDDGQVAEGTGGGGRWSGRR